MGQVWDKVLKKSIDYGLLTQTSTKLYKQVFNVKNEIIFTLVTII